ncbi:metalloregulator ArsR/SmtB family transcription factor [Porticoccaceae bacterium LTM1]|nr:metalloregulator ArsR/SmtB family transcription factor [Porticoccaceae bacterium LTM1]
MQMTLSDMEQKVDQASAVMKLLANPGRLKILCLLCESPRSVGELVDTVGLSQSALSQHLTKMRQEGLVSPTRQGLEQIYKIDNPVVLKLLKVLYEHYCLQES